MRGFFFGGVFPAARKESTRRKPLAQLARQPEQVAIPLVMSSGAPAVPTAKPGDRVAVGQMIASRAQDGAAAHASVSGQVRGIEDRPHPWGGSGPAIVIDNDGKNTPWQGRPEPLEPKEVTLEQLVERVAEAGIIGMGGGARPAWEKLEQAAGKVDTLILNAAECEPYVTADHRLLLERSDQILRGARTLARCVGAKRTVLVTEGDKLNAAEAVERRLRRRKTGVELLTVRTRYPLGAEKQIIQAVTGREVPPGGTPLDVKSLVFNVATVYAIQEALFKGLALTHRAVTVTGGAVTRPRNLWVPIGTPMSLLLEEAGGLREEAEKVKIITGGPMMGLPVESLDAPVVKNTSSLICLADWERRDEGPETVCIRCGKCVAACPMHLAPAFIGRALREGDRKRLARLHVEDCIHCGCCSFICPARIPLVELVRQAAQTLEKGGEA